MVMQPVNVNIPQVDPSLMRGLPPGNAVKSFFDGMSEGQDLRKNRELNKELMDQLEEGRKFREQHGAELAELRALELANTLTQKRNEGELLPKKHELDTFKTEDEITNIKFPHQNLAVKAAIEGVPAADLSEFFPEDRRSVLDLGENLFKTRKQQSNPILGVKEYFENLYGPGVEAEPSKDLSGIDFFKGNQERQQVGRFRPIWRNGKLELDSVNDQSTVAIPVPKPEGGTLGYMVGDRFVENKPDKQNMLEGMSDGAAKIAERQAMKFESHPTVKNYQESWTNYQKLDRLAADGENASAQSDLALLYAFMKAQDPESVVRESEFASAAQAGHLGDRLQNMVSKVLNGQRLTQDQRTGFLKAAKQALSAHRSAYESTRKTYMTRAQTYGIPPEFVIGEDEFPMPDEERRPEAKKEPQKAGEEIIPAPSHLREGSVTKPDANGKRYVVVNGTLRPYNPDQGKMASVQSEPQYQGPRPFSIPKQETSRAGSLSDYEISKRESEIRKLAENPFNPRNSKRIQELQNEIAALRGQ